MQFHVTAVNRGIAKLVLQPSDHLIYKRVNAQMIVTSVLGLYVCG